MLSQLTKRRKVAIAAIIFLQLIILLGMAAQREWVRYQGTSIVLQTIPVDPRDIFRGDYVQLDFDITHPDSNILKKFLARSPELAASLASHPAQKPWVKKVYLILSVPQPDTQSQAAKLSGISAKRPTEGFFITAKLSVKKWNSSNNEGSANLTLGIEKYFVEQGAGLEIEAQRGAGEDWQTAMLLETTVGSNGMAVITGHRWNPLSVRLKRITPRANNENENTATVFELGLRNNSNAAMKIPSGEQHCQWQLYRADTLHYSEEQLKASAALPLINQDCKNQAILQNPIVLQSQQAHDIRVDLQDDKWFVRDTEGHPTSVNTLQGSAFRFVFTHSNGQEYQSARFWPNGRID